MMPSTMTKGGKPKSDIATAAPMGSHTLASVILVWRRVRTTGITKSAMIAGRTPRRKAAICGCVRTSPNRPAMNTIIIKGGSSRPPTAARLPAFPCNSRPRRVQRLMLNTPGIAFATRHHIRNSRSVRKDATASAVSHDDNKVQSSSVVFDDVRLDSILSVVSAHYGKKVDFGSKEAKDMKFIMTWNPDSSLTSFIDLINMFDGLHLSVRRDTIFVETMDVEE